MEDRILQAVNRAIGEAIKQELVGYGKPLSQLVEKVVASNRDELHELINCEFAELLTAESFRLALKVALNEKLAKVLIARMGGELESQVNKLKGNPTTRAKITLAISNIIEEFQSEGAVARPDDEVPF